MSTTESGIRIRTNNIPRDVIHAWELSPTERAEFDYLDWEAIDDGRDSAEFVRFRSELICLGEFSRVIAPDAIRRHPMECAEPAFQGWDGYVSDSFFSGTLIRWARDENGELDSERVVIGTYLA